MRLKRSKCEFLQQLGWQLFESHVKRKLNPTNREIEPGRLGEQKTKGIDRKRDNEEEEEKEPLASIGEGSVAGRRRRRPSSSGRMCPPPARSVCHRRRSPPRPRPSPFAAVLRRPGRKP